MYLFFCIFANMQKTTKPLFLVIVLWSAITLLGCTNSFTGRQLSTVDSLLAVDNLNDAENKLHQIKGMDMNESELAKYNFLSIQKVIGDIVIKKMVYLSK